MLRDESRNLRIRIKGITINAPGVHFIPALRTLIEVQVQFFPRVRRLSHMRNRDAKFMKETIYIYKEQFFFNFLTYCDMK